jgi:hypothetical protein
MPMDPFVAELILIKQKEKNWVEQLLPEVSFMEKERHQLAKTAPPYSEAQHSSNRQPEKPRLAVNWER